MSVTERFDSGTVNERYLPPGSPGPLAEDASPAGESDITLLDLCNTILRRRGLIVGLPLLFAAITAVIVLILPRQYSVRASFTPQAADTGPTGSLSSLTGLASQFGINLPLSSGAQTPDFYADLLQSPMLMRDIVTHRYSYVDGKDTVRGTYAKIFEIDGDSRGDSTASAIEDLGDNTSITSDATTGLVSIVVKTKYPEVSLQIAQQMLSTLDSLNQWSRADQAGAELRFVQGRVDSSAIELHAAEDRLEAFLVRNRTYQSDPQLATEFDRLQRDVNMRQAVYTTLEQMLEQDRITAVRNTPSLVIAETPFFPLRPDKRRGVLKTAAAAVGGLVIAVLLAFLFEFSATLSEDVPDRYEEFAKLKLEAWDEVRHPWRSIRSRASRVRWPRRKTRVAA